MSLKDFLQDLATNPTKAEQFATSVKDAGELMATWNLTADEQSALLAGDVARIHTLLNAAGGQAVNEFTMATKPKAFGGPRTFLVKVNTDSGT